MIDIQFDPPIAQQKVIITMSYENALALRLFIGKHSMTELRPAGLEELWDRLSVKVTR